ncbi:MAG: thioredoxin family protein [Proteobacteria bacterium]|jgi:hypothetical protein|nr:thioredoxin family protein [Pseudomonadota bacterium]
MALTFTPQDDLGKILPPFKLKALDGSWMTDQDLPQAKAWLFMFICNHCPYVKAIESRLLQLSLDLKKLGIETIAICSNDPVEYPEDNEAALNEHWTKLGKPFWKYLHDPDQSVALQFGAVCTPDFFLFNADRVLVYRGRLDDSWKNEKQVKHRELFEAAQELVTYGQVHRIQKPSMGCNIKWSSR